LQKDRAEAVPPRDLRSRLHSSRRTPSRLSRRGDAPSRTGASLPRRRPSQSFKSAHRTAGRHAYVPPGHLQNHGTPIHTLWRRTEKLGAIIYLLDLRILAVPSISRNRTTGFSAPRMNRGQSGGQCSCEHLQRRENKGRFVVSSIPPLATIQRDDSQSGFFDRAD
jgi:hypothetical protein